MAATASDFHHIDRPRPVIINMAALVDGNKSGAMNHIAISYDTTTSVTLNFMPS